MMEVNYKAATLLRHIFKVFKWVTIFQGAKTQFKFEEEVLSLTTLMS